MVAGCVRPEARERRGPSAVAHDGRHSCRERIPRAARRAARVVACARMRFDRHPVASLDVAWRARSAIGDERERKEGGGARGLVERGGWWWLERS